jgi:RNA polymerase sigma-70 factor (ECF subfamily)
MTNLSDIHIFQQIKNGDVAAFNQLFDNYYPPMCYLACKYLVDMDLSRSLVQEVFVDLWTRREKISVDYSVKSYLFNMVKNRSIDHLRRHKKDIQLTESEEEMIHAPFHDIIEEAELNHRINASINELPEKCREIFLLCRFEGMKYAEIARKLDISVKTVEMQMGIALKKMRSSLSDYQMVNLMVFVHSKKI